MPNNIIDSIRLSGTTYQIQGSGGGGTQAIELTQAQYDALVDKDPNVFYIITDAEAGDLTNYYTKTETNTLLGDKADTATTYTKTEVDTALDDKQDALVSSQNIKTINNESLLGSGNIDIQGGGSSYTAGDGIDITNDVISVSGVSHNSLADGTKMLLRGDVSSVGQNYSNIGFDYYYGTSSNKNSIKIKPLKINGESALRTAALSISVVETSAITTSVTSSSTDAQVPSAKAVNDKLGGLSLVKLTQSEYDALATKDSNTLYVIVD